MLLEKETDFEHFLEIFPEVKLPILLNDEALHVFDAKNEPIPELMIVEYLHSLEKEKPDEFTEYIACFKMPETISFHAIVYWRGALMDQQFILATFDKKGNFIDKKTLARTFSDGNLLTTSMALIEDDWVIHIASGQKKSDVLDYEANSSNTKQIELLPDGKIISL